MAYNLLETSKALGDETRLSIYRYLERPQREPTSVQLLAKHFNLHPNAIRQHLAKLERAGLVFSEFSRPAKIGRPQRIYKVKGPVRCEEGLPRDYKLLCEMLLEFLASSNVPIEEIKRFGHRWGERLAGLRIAQGEVYRSPEEMTRMLVSQFSGLGFEPAVIARSEGRIEIRLQNCIFREVVEFHPDIVCPLLHGVLEGMIAPFIGSRPTELENGIAHGQKFCEVVVLLKTTAI